MSHLVVGFPSETEQVKSSNYLFGQTDPDSARGSVYSIKQSTLSVTRCEKTWAELKAQASRLARLQCLFSLHYWNKFWLFH